MEISQNFVAFSEYMDFTNCSTSSYATHHLLKHLYIEGFVTPSYDGWYKRRKLDSLSFSVLATHPGFLLKRILSKGKLLIFSKTCKTDGSIILTK